MHTGRVSNVKIGLAHNGRSLLVLKVPDWRSSIEVSTAVMNAKTAFEWDSGLGRGNGSSVGMRTGVHSGKCLSTQNA